MPPRISLRLVLSSHLSSQSRLVSRDSLVSRLFSHTRSQAALSCTELQQQIPVHWLFSKPPTCETFHHVSTHAGIYHLRSNLKNASKRAASSSSAVFRNTCNTASNHNASHRHHACMISSHQNEALYHPADANCSPFRSSAIRKQLSFEIPLDV